MFSQIIVSYDLFQLFNKEANIYWYYVIDESSERLLFTLKSYIKIVTNIEVIYSIHNVISWNIVNTAIT
jgi:hypothetical protein